VAKTKSNPSADLAERLRHLREARSMNVAEFAKLINVSPAAIWHWEHRGTTPRSGTVNAIAQRLGVTRSFLETGKLSGGEKHNGTAVSVKATSDEMSLEQLIRSIEAKGFEVSVKSKAERRS
jgi:transcriptional regulator with XRE-family HTH domain